MRRKLLCVAFIGALAGVAFADERPVAKGPAEDGTLPALAAVAGQGLMNSHTYDYLTESSVDILATTVRIRNRKFLAIVVC